MKEFESLYGNPESSTGLVREEAFLDEITSFIDNEEVRQLSKKLLAFALSELPVEQEFCITSNEIGVKLEEAGQLELAAECYDWSFQQSDSLENFLKPNVVAYGGNLIRVLQRIAGQPNLSEQGKAFLKDHKKVVGDIGTFLGFRKNYAIGLRASAQLKQQGGIVWNGDEDQTLTMQFQETEQAAITLANLL